MTGQQDAERRMEVETMTDLERMELAVRRVVEFMGRQPYTPSGEEMFKALVNELEEMNTERTTPPRGTGEG